MMIGLKRIFVGTIASTLVLLAPLSAAQAADPGFCRTYAQAAQNQVRTALRSPRCRAGIEGARWSSDRKVHFDWCLTASRADADSERGARTGYLRGCR